MASIGGSMKKKILLKGPLLTRSGYGEQARFALRSLLSREDLFDIYIQPLRWGNTSWLNEDNDQRRWVDQTIEKTIGYIQQGGSFDVSLQVTIPNEFEKLAPVNIGYTAGIETTKIAPQWIEKINQMDTVIVVSEHSKDVIENTEYRARYEETGQEFTLKTQVPIKSVGYPVKTFDSLPDLDLNIDTAYNFLTVSQFGPRKNLTNTIKWFINEFRDEDVGLVLKSNIAKNCLMDRSRLHKDLVSFVNKQGPKTCKVYLLHGDMTDEEMHSLYNHPKINAFVSLPHGEGFGLPIFEAGYSGLPVVTVGWSGQLDFLSNNGKDDDFYNVAFDIQPVQDEVVWDGVLIKDSMWAYARESSAKEQMRACYEDTKNRDRDTKLQTRLLNDFSNTKMYEKFVDAFYVDDHVSDDEIEALFASLSD
jgi:glycosyltransferase involved in cell wall biosynthesis